MEKPEEEIIFFSYHLLPGVKTAAAVAGGAYVGYQLGKFTGRLSNCSLFLSAILQLRNTRFDVQIWPLGARRWLGAQGLQSMEGAGWDALQVDRVFEIEEALFVFV